MLQLKTKTLTPACQAHLDLQQIDIDSQTLFVNKTTRAGSLWSAKTSSIAGNAAFTEIKTALVSMCIGVEICNYCEQSEASDIEHILPKSIFPSQAFKWQNYLLACKKCNTAHKMDTMYVFNPGGSASVFLVSRGTEPPTTDYAYIHPRLENPLEWMQLNFKDFLFYARPPHAPGSRGFEKVERTLEILELNNRPNLVKYRREAFDNYKRMLREYVEVKKSTNHSDLDHAVTGNPNVDYTVPFATEQTRILSSLQKSIQTSEHPTVWHEMVRQRATLHPLIQQLFTQATEALSW